MGYDHLSIPQAKAKGIAVTNTPGVLTDATADIALLLILGAARGASWGDRMVRENRWGETTLISPMGHDVSGKRLGILGMGRIGQAVAKRARAFGMEHPLPFAPPGGGGGCARRPLPRAASRTCCRTAISCRSTVPRRRRRAASSTPRPSRCCRTAPSWSTRRAATSWTTSALIAALTSGKLAAAGLDVFKGEPKIDPRYRGLENVFLLPHIGSATPGTRSAMGHKCIDNLRAVLPRRAADRPADRQVTHADVMLQSARFEPLGNARMP